MLKTIFIGISTAIRFLTIIPFPFFAKRDGEYFSASARYFVLVGTLIGLFNFTLFSALLPFLPHTVSCCLAIISLSLITGFLHLDGLADTADGFFSARPTEQILEIMHDSRNGSMGILGIFFVLLIKYSSLIAIPHSQLPLVLLVIPVCGRLSINVLMFLLPYARSGGLGKLFYASSKTTTLIWAVVLFICNLIMVPFPKLLLCGVTVILCTLLFSLWCKKKIGGATGDTLGASCEINEAAVCLALAIFYHSNI